MPATIPAAAEDEVLDQLTDALTLKVMLFSNDVTIDDTTTLADLTECDFSGYAQVTLNFASAAFQNPDDKGQIDADRATFTHDSGGTSNLVYGYAIFFDGGGLFAVEKFLAPIGMSSNGQTINLDLSVTVSDDV